MTDAVIEFRSKECKTGQHQNCCGRWQGLGFEINCNCLCGHKKNYWMLDSVDGPRANTNHSIQSLSLTGASNQEND